MKWRKSAESGAKVGQQCCEILECASEEALSAYARLRVCVCKAGVSAGMFVRCARWRMSADEMALEIDFKWQISSKCQFQLSVEWLLLPTRRGWYVSNGK